VLTVLTVLTGTQLTITRYPAWGIINQFNEPPVNSGRYKPGDK
jgi:hypothetical protein